MHGRGRTRMRMVLAGGMLVSRRVCSGCSRRLLRGTHSVVAGICYDCRRRGEPGTGQVVRDPVREERIRQYQGRAASERPLFTPPLPPSLLEE